MVRQYGHIGARFEEYIRERTADHSSLGPMVMGNQGKARFRLVCKATLRKSLV